MARGYLLRANHSAVGIRPLTAETLNLGSVSVGSSTHKAVGGAAVLQTGEVCAVEQNRRMERFPSYETAGRSGVNPRATDGSLPTITSAGQEAVAT